SRLPHSGSRTCWSSRARGRESAGIARPVRDGNPSHRRSPPGPTRSRSRAACKPRIPALRPTPPDSAAYASASPSAFATRRSPRRTVPLAPTALLDQSDARENETELAAVVLRCPHFVDLRRDKIRLIYHQPGGRRGLLEMVLPGCRVTHFLHQVIVQGERNRH